MPMVKKSITVTDEQEKWIQARMKTGNYASDSEVIREALRKVQVEEAQVDFVRQALKDGEDSGFVEADKDGHLKRIKDRLKKNGRL